MIRKPGKTADASARSVHWIILATTILFIAACFLPATDIGTFPEEGDRRVPGFVHLLFGFLWGPRAYPAWSANFILWSGVILLYRRCFRIAFLLGATAFLLGLTTLVSFKWEEKYVGYYVWQGSHLTLALGAFREWYRAKLLPRLTLPLPGR